VARLPSGAEGSEAGTADPAVGTGPFEPETIETESQFSHSSAINLLVIC
jgi:hypothetical protein